MRSHSKCPKMGHFWYRCPKCPKWGTKWGTFQHFNLHQSVSESPLPCGLFVPSITSFTWGVGENFVDVEGSFNSPTSEWKSLIFIIEVMTCTRPLNDFWPSKWALSLKNNDRSLMYVFSSFQWYITCLSMKKLIFCHFSSTSFKMGSKWPSSLKTITYS